MGFGSGPLAVLAYKYGTGGVREAILKVGSRDIKDILSKFKHPNFQFASRNFYADLIAAIEVEKNYKQYFRGLKKKRSIQFVEVAVLDYIKAHDLLRGIRLEESLFRELNPAFKSVVWRGRVKIPALYKIKIPARWGKNQGSAREAFWVAYNRIPKDKKFRDPKGNTVNRKISSQ